MFVTNICTYIYKFTCMRSEPHITLQHTATQCNITQHTCNTMPGAAPQQKTAQHSTATYYNTLQHTATSCYIPATSRAHTAP